MKIYVRSSTLLWFAPACKEVFWTKGLIWDVHCDTAENGLSTRQP